MMLREQREKRLLEKLELILNLLQQQLTQRKLLILLPVF
jgi:hypothetical protein